MSRLRRIGLLGGVMLLAAACGAGAEDGGGDTDLPTRAAGPYEKLSPDPKTPIEEPVVLEDPSGDLAYYAPAVLTSGPDLYTVFFTGDDGFRADIRRVDGVDLVETPAEADVVLEADAVWEASRVAHPAVLSPGPTAAYGLFYEAGAGAIGYAESEDGYVFVKHPDNPILTATLPEEGDWIGQPSVVRQGSGYLLYYAARDPGAIFAARLSWADGGVLVISKVDADPETAPHDPVLGPNHFALQFDEVAVAGPTLLVTDEADRPVYDMWYAGQDEKGRWSVGFAGSYDGIVFKRYTENPVLPQGGVDESDPCVIHRGIAAMMFFTEGAEEDRVIGVARY